jgi:type IV pilus assembly protein PilX
MLATTAIRQLVDWDGNGCQGAASGSYNGCSVLSASAGTINGNAARYVVFRLCSKPGDYLSDKTINCAQRAASTGSCGSKGALSYSENPLSCSTTSAYYRIVVRVLGARNTASYTETIVHF